MKLRHLVLSDEVWEKIDSRGDTSAAVADAIELAWQSRHDPLLIGVQLAVDDGRCFFDRIEWSPNVSLDSKVPVLSFRRHDGSYVNIWFGEDVTVDSNGSCPSGSEVLWDMWEQ